MSCRLAFGNKKRSAVWLKFKLTNETLASLVPGENASQVLTDKVLGIFADKEEDAKWEGEDEDGEEAEEWEEWLYLKAR